MVVARVYDGFLNPRPSGLSTTPAIGSPSAAIIPPGIAAIPADIDVAALVFETETDVTFFADAG